MRIKDAVRPKIQNSFIGIESTLARNSGQQTREKEYTFVSRLSNSDLSTNYAPTWKVDSHLGKIGTVEKFILTGSVSTITIPQLNMEDLTYSIKAVSEPDENANLYGVTYPDETSLTVDFSNGEFLIGIVENNTPLANEKFDIEIFEVYPSPDEPEKLVPLRFKEKISNIVDGLYVDLDEKGEEDSDDEMLVENRFILEVDTEIDRDILRMAIGASGVISDQSELRTFGESGLIVQVTDESSTRFVDGLSLDDIAGLSPEQIEQLRNEQQDAPLDDSSNNPAPGQCED